LEHAFKNARLRRQVIYFAAHCESLALFAVDVSDQ
jgi:hypothetical protein